VPKPRYFRVTHQEGQHATFLLRPQTVLGEDIVQVDGAATYPEPVSITVMVFELNTTTPDTAIYTDTLSSFPVSGPNLFSSLQTDSKWPRSTGGYTFLYRIDHDDSGATGVNWIAHSVYQVEFSFTDSSGGGGGFYDSVRGAFVVDVGPRRTHPGP